MEPAWAMFLAGFVAGIATIVVGIVAAAAYMRREK